MTFLSLRHFCRDDCDVLSRTFYPGATNESILAMIEEWNSLTHNGSYFEMFAVQTESGLAGRVSLYENEENGVSLGVDIIPEFRRQSIAFAAVMEALRHARTCGYRQAIAMARKNNIPSLNLCKKLGFTCAGETVTSKGAEVYLFRFDL